MSVKVSKVEEGLHVVKANVCQVHGQLDQIVQLFQNHTPSSNLSNTEPNLKREGKKHAKKITLRSRVVVKEPTCPVKGKKDESTHNPNVGDGVGKKEGVESELT
ncbi:hypothetical protein PVK06_041000 [Gossypium arboreum]|uniref:Uncharacterized protein n=1 Tax=Gossypium arboreum TaxID=29729 RepID=A0ABR0N751_GOSAR|nr:hypothetical protein PVK06_041000 [Gossypium arboreum]